MITEFFGTVLAVEYSVANRKRFVDSNQPFFLLCMQLAILPPQFIPKISRGVFAPSLCFESIVGPRSPSKRSVSLKIESLEVRSLAPLDCALLVAKFFYVLTLLPYVFRKVEIRPPDRSSHSC